MLRFSRERQSRGWSQAELAFRSRIHPAVISRLERGVLPPYRGWKEKIAAALDWPAERADELFREEEN